MTTRFTIDGSEELEQRLEATCERVRAGVLREIPPRSVAALVLGGGYGRGQGGVLRTPAGDHPYNDMEFYLFLRGNRLWNERKYRHPLAALADELSPEAGLHIEFKIESLERFRRAPVSMFSYDLVSGHRVIIGSAGAMAGCSRHLAAEQIPLSEGTRLLFNRCTGLLLAERMLRQATWGDEQADFVGRNLAKAWMALGDAVLTAAGQYHWSCLERRQRLQTLALDGPPPGLAAIKLMHSQGVDFKLHPRKATNPREEFNAEHRRTVTMALRLWLWLESRRLNRPFATVEEYAASDIDKCPETSRWRNYLLNLKTFGWSSVFAPNAGRYPRERLLCSLPLLLARSEARVDPEVRQRLQRNLQTAATDWQGLSHSYQQLWPALG
ncbi:MAG TPA: hypothetical protein VN673_04230 [Clostridia bacterium]|nr:hypothetical protein [Clostridia bacterium]